MLRKIIISLIGLYVLYLCALPVVVSNLMKAVCNNFSHNSVYEIKINEFHTRFSILPVITFKIDELSFGAKNQSFLLRLENVKLKLRILPLTSGKFHINDLQLSKVYLTADLVDDLALDKNFFHRIQKVPLNFDSISIGEFQAEFKQKDINEPIIYKGQGFNFQRKNRYLKLKTNSTLNVEGNISKVVSNLYLPKNNDIKKTVFDIEISNVNVAPLRAYFKHYLPKDLEQLRGKVNVQATKEGLTTELNNCAILMKDSAKSIIFPKKMFIKSKFNITKDFINFENIDLDSKNIHATIEGKFENYFGRTKPTVNLKVRINKSRIEDIIEILPPFKVEEIDVYKLKKYKFYGEILANFTIKGRLPEPDINGDIYINDGVLVKRIPRTNKGATIKLNLAGKMANFDIVVPAGDLEKVFVKGSQELYNIKYADFYVKSSENVNLKSAQDVVNPLHEVLNFIIGPVPIMDINGKGNIDITVKGNRKSPHIWGIFNVKNGNVWFTQAPKLVLKDSDAILRFDDQNVLFETQKGVLNNKNIDIKGNCNLLGQFDFDVESKMQPTKELYEAVISNTMFPEIHKILPQIDAVSGFADWSLKLYGVVKNINDLSFNKNVFAKGEINLFDNNFVIQNIGIEKTNGKIVFDNLNSEANINASIGNLPMNIKSKIKNGFADLYVDIPRMNPNFLISDIETRKKQYLPYLSVNGKYKGNIESINFKNLNLKATILDSIPNGRIKYNSGGVINISNGKVVIKNVKGYIIDKLNSFDLDLIINNAFNGEVDANGYLKFSTPNLSSVNEILLSEILPENIRKYVKDYEFKKGELNLNTKISNNKMNLYADLAGISFNYLPYNMPIDIVNGTMNVKNNTLKLNKINLLADDMPVLIDGEVKDIFNKQNFNLYLNSKPRQEFIDKYINKNQIYPIKIKGDIVYWLKLKGVSDDYDLKAQIDMSRDSSFYHFGATIGDVENAIVVSIDSKVTDGNIHKIKEFSYDKKIDSQSGRSTRLNMLKAWGGVQVFKEDLVFDNLRIKTSNPTDARIFNIIFRKPNIKQGQFISDLRINGKLSNPKVLGDFHIFETNIPFMDTTMKNIELVFKDKIIEFDSKGEIMGNDVTFNGILKNQLTVPYKIEKGSLYTKDLDLNRIINKLKIAEVDGVSAFDSLESFDIKSISTNNFKFIADNVQLRNIHATDFEAITSLSENGLFDVKNFKFNIAQGELQGKYSYNFKNSNMSLNLKADSISANDITWALFDLNNQIHGDLTGSVNLTCSGEGFNQCMETLSGNTLFNVKDGRMPKLGSLEYLLKASNLVKGGLTGLSINSVIDLIAPSKTGEFSDIFGSVRIKDGVARNIEITTKGEDLSLYISGTYNFATSIADMEVLGLLSRKISTLFGPIGNVSINTLFNIIPGVDLSKDSLVLERINKIPGIELSSKAYRKFIAEIKGNINGDDYVTSFKWIN